MIYYIDTSAWLKLLVEEAESKALAGWSDSTLEAADSLVSSILISTELHRVAQRAGLDHGAVNEMLDRLDLVSADDQVFTVAGLLPGDNLRSLDALHLATALQVGAQQLVCYDHRMQDAARAVGLRVLAPGAG